MPSLRAHSFNQDRLELVAGNGRTFTVTRQEIRTTFLAQTGTLAQRRTKTMDWIRQQAQAALGPDHLTLTDMDLDVDETAGSLRKLAFGGDA